MEELGYDVWVCDYRYDNGAVRSIAVLVPVPEYSSDGRDERLIQFLEVACANRRFPSGTVRHVQLLRWQACTPNPDRNFVVCTPLAK